MTEGVILDTGPLVAYLIEQDDYHAWAVQMFSDLPPLFWTCEAVLTEAAYLTGHDPRAMRLVGDFLEHGWLRIPFQFAPEQKRVIELMEQYHSTPMSFADACLVRMTEMLDGCSVMTIDHDFEVYRKHRRQRIPTLMPASRR